MNLRWELLGDGVWRTRLPFLDVTVGLIAGDSTATLVDAGSTHAEARAIASDVRALTGQHVTQIILTHNHFDHVLGSSWFGGAELYGASAMPLTSYAEHFRADALGHGADHVEIDRTISALRNVDHRILDADVVFGDRRIIIAHPGRGHTDHDLIVTVPGDRPIVFCGDLIEESGDPVYDTDSDLAAWPATLDRVIAAGGADATFVPGHGAVVDVDFVRRQQHWLSNRS